MKQPSIVCLALTALVLCFLGPWIFGARTAFPQAGAPGEELGLRLVGTAVSDNPEQSLAVMEDRSTGEQGTYSEGDRVGEFLIKKILFGKVVFDTGTGDAILSVGSGHLAGSRPPAPETGPLTKKEVDAALPDYTALMRQIRVRSQFQGGRPAGFVIYKIEPGSIFERMGLENSDVIVKVNGMEITSSQPVMEFYDALKAGGTISLEVRREETTRDLMFEID
jgi:general secretion pathway protein C